MRLNLYEHQSTKCPNMPLRSLIYIAGLLKDYVAENEFDLQGTRMIQIPTPKFVVFYNGLENAPEREVLRLSDCYMNKKDAPELEIYCTIININQGNNEEMLQRCSVLSEYTTFVETVRELVSSGAKRPIAKAIDTCISKGCLAEFLRKHRSEVLKVMTLDMTWETREKYIRRDERAEGRTELLLELIQKKLAKGKTLEQIAEELETEVSVIQEFI